MVSLVFFLGFLLEDRVACNAASPAHFRAATITQGSHNKVRAVCAPPASGILCGSWSHCKSLITLFILWSLEGLNLAVCDINHIKLLTYAEIMIYNEQRYHINVWHPHTNQHVMCWRTPPWLIKFDCFMSQRCAPCSSWSCTSLPWLAACGGSYWQSLGSWPLCLNGAAKPSRRKPSSSMLLPGDFQGPWLLPCWPWIRLKEMGSVECVS